VIGAGPPARGTIEISAQFKNSSEIWWFACKQWGALGNKSDMRTFVTSKCTRHVSSYVSQYIFFRFTSMPRQVMSYLSYRVGRVGGITRVCRVVVPAKNTVRARHSHGQLHRGNWQLGLVQIFQTRPIKSLAYDGAISYYSFTAGASFTDSR
jgi:hypothetical protein